MGYGADPSDVVCRRYVKPVCPVLGAATGGQRWYLRLCVVHAVLVLRAAPSATKPRLPTAERELCAGVPGRGDPAVV
ncbi:hypothetical protein D3C76_1669030 [compost metagenome]